jgi:hypothetical protein
VLISRAVIYSPFSLHIDNSFSSCCPIVFNYEHSYYEHFFVGEYKVYVIGNNSLFGNIEYTLRSRTCMSTLEHYDFFSMFYRVYKLTALGGIKPN